MNKASRMNRLRYGLDNYMSRGSAALFGGRAVVTAVLVLGLSVIVWGFMLDSALTFSNLDHIIVVAES